MLYRMMDHEAPAGVNPHVPNAARMFDYYLGGKDHFAVDRAAAQQVLAFMPQMREVARAGRDLIGRVVRRLVAEEGITQIIDLGSGLPTRDNVHQIAHRVAPETRVVYVDNDEVVCAHGRALLADPGRVTVVRGDIRKPAEILADPQLRAVVDLDEPVAVLMMYVLHLIPDTDGPHEAVDTIRDTVAPGSFLAVSHACDDANPPYMARITAIYERANSPFVPRSRAAIARFFGDFAMLPPGLVNVWPYPTPPAPMDPELAATGYSGVGRKI
jgi:SAM-dependent methyltransferase